MVWCELIVPNSEKIKFLILKQSNNDYLSSIISILSLVGNEHKNIEPQIYALHVNCTINAKSFKYIWHKNIYFNSQGNIKLLNV